MLRLIINDFKCWKNLTFEFNEGKVTLIKGTSGAGKTTILRAIYWCLYGTIKNVKPISETNNRKCNTSVEIQFDKYYIRRSKNPESLTLIYNNYQYDNLGAQDKINEFFGSNEAWLSCCYVQQKSNNYFILASNNDKLRILSELTFQDEDPNIYISKVDNLIKKHNILYTSEEDRFNSLLNEYNHKMSQLNNNHNLTQEELNNIKSEINIMKDEVDLIRTNEVTIKFKTETKNSLVSQLNLQTLKDEIKLTITDQELNELELNLNRYNEYQKLKSKHDSIITNHYTEVFNEFDYDTCVKQHGLYDNMNNTFRKYNIVSGNDLNSVIKDLEDKYNHDTKENEKFERYSTYLRHKKQLDDLKIELESINLNIPVPVKPQEPDGVNYTTRYNELMAESQIINNKINNLNLLLECPDCNTKLKIDNYKLVKAPVTDINQLKQEQVVNHNNIQEILNKINHNQHLSNLNIQYNHEYKAYRDKIFNLNNRVDSLKHKISAYDGLVKPEESTLKTLIPIDKSKINVLKSIEIYNKPKHEPSYIRKCINNLKNIKLKDDTKAKLDSIGFKFNFNVEDLRHRINQAKDERQSKREVELYNEGIRRIRSSLELKIKDIVIPEARMYKGMNKEQLQIKIKEYNTKLNNYETYNNVVSYINNYKAFKNYLESYTNWLRGLKRIKEILIQTYCSKLENMSNVINSNLSSVIGSVFNEECIIHLDLYKTLKSNNQKRQQVNFNIIHKGVKYDQLDHMSGGEMDRISLAVTMGLSSVSNFPFIFLDEVLSSLDVETRDHSIESIKSLTGKGVIIIGHDTTTQVFDDIVEL